MAFGPQTTAPCELKTGQLNASPPPLQQRISADGSTAFLAEAGRYHLYVALACPWAQRAMIARKLKKLDKVISQSIVDWRITEDGWQFGDRDNANADPLLGAQYLREIYQASDSLYTGRASVPILWDKKTDSIVNNESADIVRMLNQEFSAFSKDSVNLYPKNLQSEIDALNDLIYNYITNGVVGCVTADSQATYEEVFNGLFCTLSEMEQRLSKQRYLVGDQITEADVRFFTTLVRFDSVYYHLFKCNHRRIIDYPNLWGYLRDLYQHPGISETVDFTHIKSHYHLCYPKLNPGSIIAKGPDINFNKPHGRDILA